ncbi:Retrovirus-related Pol polyprotein from transposon [Ceratobasidium sp. AG-Ba]|nr:Retrovirus-related Pol polyprotein from transposon [Ceratobasidium sp. AG-Ba]
MTSKDFRAAQANLSRLPRFNDDMDPMRESEWRHHFTVATRGVTDEEQAQLWADWLVYEGVAYDWLESLQRSGASGLADSQDWSKLRPLIEARWPTPVRDPFVLAEQKRHRWDNSIFRVEDVLAALKDKSNPVRPHEVWATQHLSQGKDRGSSNDDLVHDTLKRAIPPWMISLLPKRSRYGSDFEGLCKDIGELSSAEIVNAHSVDQAVHSIQNLALGPSSKPVARTPAVSPYPSSLRRAPTPVPNAPSSPFSQGPIPAPSFAPTRAPQVAFAPLPPETPARNQPSCDNPPHMPDSNAPMAAQAPQTPSQRTMRDPVPELVPNTLEERTRYNTLVSKFNNKYGIRATPTMSKPYPLTPGTFKQTRDVCVRCGQSEQSMRMAIVGSLWRPNARAGTVPGTPTPGQRFVRDTAQLEEDEEEIPYTEHFESENEEAPAGWSTPGAGHLSVCESSETIYVSPDVGFELAINDFDSYPAPPEVIDLYEIFDPNKYKDKPFQVWAHVARVGETGPKLDTRVTVDGGAMLCVMDKTFWGQVEAHLGELAKSPIVCRMADGSCTRSIGTGNALVGVASQWHPIQFEVLDSRGNYDLLLGKPWLRTAGAAQIFAGDTLLIAGPSGPIELANGHPLPSSPATPPLMTRQAPTQEPVPAPDPPGTGPKLDDEPDVQGVTEPSESVPLWRSRRLCKEPVVESDESDNPFWLDGAMVEKLEQWVGMSTECEIDEGRTEEYEIKESVVVQKVETESEDEFLERMWKMACQEREEITQREILLTELIEQDARVHRLQEVLDQALRALEQAKGPADIFDLQNDHLERHPTAQRRVDAPPTAESDRLKNPFDPDRVADIQRKVTIGDDLTPDQKKRVSDLVGEYADIFARSLSEVLPIDFMQMKLDIPEGTQFPRRAGQKRLTEPQREWLYKTLDDMEQAKIIAKVSQDQVAAVSPTNIVPKPGGAELPSLASLRNLIVPELMSISPENCCIPPENFCIPPEDCYISPEDCYISPEVSSI